MSGGAFNYAQFQLMQMADDIEQHIIINNVTDEWGNRPDYSEETLEQFRIAVAKLREAYVYVQRIDYLLCGDDGEDTFHKRLKKDLEAQTNDDV